MGVLFVDLNHGTGLAPDWQEVGCGEGAAGRLMLQQPDGSWVVERCAGATGPALTDDFNRANGNLTSPWVSTFTFDKSKPAVNPMQIFSNKAGAAARAFSASTSASTLAYQECGAADGTVQATMSAPGYSGASGNFQGLAFRVAPDGSYLFTDYNDLWYSDAAGNVSVLATALMWPDHLGSSSATVKVVLNGTSIKCYDHLSNLVIDITSSLNVTATRHGFWTYYTNNFGTGLGGRIDDWSFASAVPGHPLQIEVDGVWTTVACMVPYTP